MRVEVLYFNGCPNHLPAVERVRDILNGMGLHHDVREIEVDTYEKAEASRFLGSPSVRINGVDINTLGAGCQGVWIDLSHIYRWCDSNWPAVS